MINNYKKPKQVTCHMSEPTDPWFQLCVDIAADVWSPGVTAQPTPPPAKGLGRSSLLLLTDPKGKAAECGAMGACYLLDCGAARGWEVLPP